MARVLVAGAGALGSVFGGFLRLAGDAVTLLGRPRHMEAIAASGLAVDGLWGKHRVAGFDVATDPRQLAGRFDVLLVTVKSYDTAATIGAVGSLLAADGTAVSLQNGLGNAETLAAAVGEHRTLAGRVIFGATVPVPGTVRVTVYAEPVLVGPLHPNRHPGLEARARAWAVHVAAAGIPAEYRADVAAAMWGKVFYNAALNPLGALLGVHYGALGEDAETRLLMDAIIDEAFAVARAEGVSLPWASATEYRALFYDKLVPSTYDHRSSMLQDLERGRRTEIDAINGEVWRRGGLHGIPTPVNELLSRLMHARERVGRPGAAAGLPCP